MGNGDLVEQLKLSGLDLVCQSNSFPGRDIYLVAKQTCYNAAKTGPQIVLEEVSSRTWEKSGAKQPSLEIKTTILGTERDLRIFDIMLRDAKESVLLARHGPSAFSPTI